jgi:hypothetical protein
MIVRTSNDVSMAAFREQYEIEAEQGLIVEQENSNRQEGVAVRVASWIGGAARSFEHVGAMKVVNWYSGRGYYRID